MNGNQFLGVAHFGARPTFASTAFSAEVHLFDFSENIPNGTEVALEIVKKIRSGKKFLSAKALVQQIQADKNMAREIFREAGIRQRAQQFGPH